MKKMIFWILCVFCIVCLISCDIFMNDAKYIVADKTSLSEYSEKLNLRSENWKKIVTSSDFQLDIEEVDGEIKSVKYGTYPAIESILDINQLEDEFARQHLSLSDADLYPFCSDMMYNRSSSSEALINSLKEEERLLHRKCFEVVVTPKIIDMVIFPLNSTDSVESDKDIRYEVIGYIPLVFFVDTENPIDDLTKDQIIAIYSGETKNFKDVGGENQEITTFQRQKKTLAYIMMDNIMDKFVFGGSPIIDYSDHKGSLPSIPAEYVNGKGSIGYALRHAADKLYGDEVKYLKINGVAPTDENVKNGTYPYYAVVYAAVKASDTDSVGNSFLDWILSDEGQECVKMAGFIPVSES